MQTTEGHEGGALSPAEARAVDLADEFGMNAVLVRLRPLDQPQRVDPRLAAGALAEAVLEVTELLAAGDWPLWHVEEPTPEQGAQAFAVLVADGAPRSMKRALVELEESHELGEWWNLDLVTEMGQGPAPWHGGPERDAPRPQPEALPASLLTGFDWSGHNPHFSS